MKHQHFTEQLSVPVDGLQTNKHYPFRPSLYSTSKDGSKSILDVAKAINWLLRWPIPGQSSGQYTTWGLSAAERIIATIVVVHCSPLHALAAHWPSPRPTRLPLGSLFGTRPVSVFWPGLAPGYCIKPSYLHYLLPSSRPLSLTASSVVSSLSLLCLVSHSLGAILVHPSELLSSCVSFSILIHMGVLILWVCFLSFFTRLLITLLRNEL